MKTKQTITPMTKTMTIKMKIKLFFAHLLAPEYVVQDFSRDFSTCFAVRHREGEIEETFTCPNPADRLATRLNRRALRKRIWQTIQGGSLL